MVVINDYSIEYYPGKSQIVITLPQTMETACNTTSPVSERKSKLTATELTAILSVVIQEVDREND